jgi:hypothetical protein
MGFYRFKGHQDFEALSFVRVDDERDVRAIPRDCLHLVWVVVLSTCSSFEGRIMISNFGSA